MWVSLVSGSTRSRAHSTRSLRVKPKRRVVEAGEQHLAGLVGADRVVERQRRARGPSPRRPSRCRTRRSTAIVTSTRARAASRSSPASISWPTAGWFCGAATTTSETSSWRSRTACSSLRPPATSLRKTSSGALLGLGAHVGAHHARLVGRDLGAFAGHDRVPGAGDAELVGAADDARDLVEVEDRRRRGDLPLDRVGAPGVGLGPRAEAPADDHVVEEDELDGAEHEGEDS